MKFYEISSSGLNHHSAQSCKSLLSHLLLNRKLETDGISIGVVKVELLHPIWSRFWRFGINAFRAKIFICRFWVWAAKIQTSIVMPFSALVRRSRWNITGLVLVIEHQVR